MTDRKYWLGFSLIPEIGAQRLRMLQAAFGDLGSAWGASAHDLQSAGLPRQALANLMRLRPTLDLDAKMEQIEKLGAYVLTLADADYPSLLRAVTNAAPVLYVRGHYSALDELALAVVGTRRTTAYGRDVAHRLCRDLAQQDVTIISGMALGVDAVAHRGALEGGGRTLAILGCGVDVIYPAAHRDLAAQIIERGALISEFPLGTRPEASHFPRRNRIISGMSLGVLVVEAPENSGALITANLAAEQGRDVFAVPGNIFSSASHGTNRLIQDGAKLVMTIDDILSELNIAYTAVETRETAEQIAPANETEAALLALMSAEFIHIDELTRLSGLSIALVSSTLTLLELKGLARSDAHMQYCLARPT